MSSTTIIAVWPGDRTEELDELRNSHGSAPIIWNAVAQRYLGLKDLEYFQHIEQVWPLYQRSDMPAHQRAVLLMTYDNAIVLREHYLRTSMDIRAFLADFPTDAQYVNHWGHIAALFETMPDCPAIGFWMTSISENPFEGDWNEEREDHDAPDWSKFWSVYECVDEWTDKAG